MISFVKEFSASEVVCLTPDQAERLFADILIELGDWSRKNLNTYTYTPSTAKPAMTGLTTVQAGKYTAIVHEG